MKRPITYLVIFFFYFFILAGCAVTPISSIQRISGLQITLSGSDKNLYALVDQNRQVVSLSSGEQKVLKFTIPQTTRVDQCFSILNQKGENLIKDTPQFRLLLIQEFREINNKKQVIENKIQENIKNEEKYRDLYSTTLSALESNRAFQNGTCYLPPQKQLPTEPHTPCKSYEECFQDGSVFCYSKLLGTEVCGNELKKEKIPGMLSAPGCGALAAKLTDEKYNMDDAIMDFVHGAVDDHADSHIDSDSFLSQLYGLFVKGANYVVKLDNAKKCRNTFVENYYGPRKRWLDAVHDIEAEPQRTQNHCFTLIKEVNKYAENVNYYINANNTLPSELDIVNSRYNSFLNKESEITGCSI